MLSDGGSGGGGAKVVGVLAALVICLIALAALNAKVFSDFRSVRRVDLRGAWTQLSNSQARMEKVFMAPEQFDRLSFRNKSAIIDRLHKGRALLNPSSIRLHGVVGLKADGRPGWVPKSMPPPNLDMVKELRVGGGFNLRLSDALPLDRDVRDSRDPQCTSDWDISRLAPASVVIVFYNEPASTLLRSVHSVYNYTPPELLEEIILVDDGSSLDWIRPDGTGELEALIALYPKMRLVRLPVRGGIVPARMAGIRAAKAPVFVILDSHIEVQPQWLEPLVARIGEEPTAVVMPQVDGLDAETFEYRGGGIGCTLGFLWKLIEHGYTPKPGISPAERVNPAPNDSVSSPTMAGGLFAANVDFFLRELQGYDEGFQYWGTENLELSFRVWTCGGRLECMPCSRVYHVFRKGGVGYSSPPYATTKNKLRLMSVWMDNYADIAYKSLGQPKMDFGDVSNVKRFREERGCKSFQWFLENVNPESYVIQIPRDVPYMGEIRAAATGGNSDSTSAMCLWSSDPHSPSNGRVSLQKCSNGGDLQWMYFSRPKWIMPVSNDESCLSSKNPQQTVWCEHANPRLDVVPIDDLNVQIKNGNRCLTADRNAQVRFTTCDLSNAMQRWQWDLYKPPQTWTPPPTASK